MILHYTSQDILHYTSQNIFIIFIMYFFRFCVECRNKVLLASSLLTREPEPTKEKGYVAILYSGIKRCIPDRHVHLPAITEYIGTLIGRAQPEIMGRY